MSAALPATANAHLSADASLLPSGLTDADTARIAAAIAAARTESTRHVYALVWGHWECWCASRGIPALAGDPIGLCAYLAERADAGRAMGTLDMSCTAIRHVHRMCGVEDPVASDAVRQVRRGLRRIYGAAPRRLARPLTVEEIRQIVGGIDPIHADRAPRRRDDPAWLRLGHAACRTRRPHPRGRRAQTSRPTPERA